MTPKWASFRHQLKLKTYVRDFAFDIVIRIHALSSILITTNRKWGISCRERTMWHFEKFPPCCNVKEWSLKLAWRMLRSNAVFMTFSRYFERIQLQSHTNSAVLYLDFSRWFNVMVCYWSGFQCSQLPSLFFFFLVKVSRHVNRESMVLYLVWRFWSIFGGTNLLQANWALGGLKWHRIRLKIIYMSTWWSAFRC